MIPYWYKDLTTKVTMKGRTMADSELALLGVGAELDVTAERRTAYLAALEAAARDDERSEVPVTTQRAFAQDWSLWCAFVAWQNQTQHGGEGVLDPVRDVTPGMLRGFVRWLDRQRKVSPTSMPRHLTGVRATLKADHGVTLTSEDLASARKAIRNMLNASGGQDAAQQKADRAERKARMRGQADLVTRDDVRAMVRAGSDTLAGARDKALAALSFAIAARVAESSALSVADVTVVAGGLEVDVPAVKGTAGRHVAVPRSDDPATCPVRLWNAWLAEYGGTDSDPAFPRFNRAGRPMDAHLSAESCRNVLNALGAAAELPQNVTGHSMRRGYITQARLDGVPVERIAAQSGHSMKSPEFWKYIDLADKWSQARAVN